jgi:N-sulfoglucosamine sulfohydrolase
MPPGWTRRRFTQASLAAAAACAADPKPGARDSAAAAGPPQGVVFITADDLGWRDLSSYGLTSIATPNIDRLVAEGVAFSRCFDVVSTCSSSRATYVTGQYPHTHGVTGLVHRHPELSLPTDHPTVMRSLEAAGFTSALQGKWHLAHGVWAEAFGYGAYLTTDIDQVIRSSDAAVGFLEAVGDARFFLELNYMQPHRDTTGEFPQREGFEVDEAAAPPPTWWGLPDWPEIRVEVAGYLSRVRWMDALIGEVLDALDRLGMAEDTLVVFISDNGPAFPGCKTTLYDRGTGTPLMFRWPAGLPPAWHDHLVPSVDLAPTLLDLLGLPPLNSAQGRSLGPLLRGDDYAPHDALFSEMEHHAGDAMPCRAVRTDRWKYIRNLTDQPYGDGDGDGDWRDALANEPDQTWDDPRPPEQLFDLEADPLERVNLVEEAEHAGVLAELRARLAAWAAETADPRAAELPV